MLILSRLPDVTQKLQERVALTVRTASEKPLTAVDVIKKSRRAK